MKNYLNNIPLRTALIIPFAFLVVMAIGFVGYVSYVNGRLAVNDVASQLRSELTLRIQDHLRRFLKTPHQINQLNAGMLSQGLLNINNPAEMERHFFSQISTFDSVTSIYMGNVDGGLVNGGRDIATNSRYIIVTDDFKSGPLHKIATTDTGRRMEILATVPNFDARTRPWYLGAVKKGAASWSPVYIISTGQDMAIAASQPIYDDQKQLLGVVSTDIFLSQRKSTGIWRGKLRNISANIACSARMATINGFWIRERSLKKHPPENPFGSLAHIRTLRVRNVRRPKKKPCRISCFRPEKQTASGGWPALSPIITTIC
jgi:hypothetical protein